MQILRVVPVDDYSDIMLFWLIHSFNLKFFRYVVIYFIYIEVVQKELHNIC